MGCCSSRNEIHTLPFNDGMWQGSFTENGRNTKVIVNQLTISKEGVIKANGTDMSGGTWTMAGQINFDEEADTNGEYKLQIVKDYLENQEISASHYYVGTIRPYHSMKGTFSSDSFERATDQSEGDFSLSLSK